MTSEIINTISLIKKLSTSAWTMILDHHIAVYMYFLHAVPHFK